MKVTDKNSWGIPNISLSQNLTSFGNPTSSPFHINDKYFQFVDNFSWVRGKHSLRMGGEYRVNHFPQLGNEFPRGQFIFSNQFTNTITPTGPTHLSGRRIYRRGLHVGLHEQLDHRGRAGSGRLSKQRMGHLYRRYLALKPALTVSLGFRWEVAQPLLDKAGLEPNVQLNEPCRMSPTCRMSKHPVYVRTGTGGFLRRLAIPVLAVYTTQARPRRLEPSPRYRRSATAPG